MIEWNNEQVDATYKFSHWWNYSSEQVFGIVGPAGSGKTTLVRHLMEENDIDLDEVMFMTYMGKAAMQLQRSGIPARTIHSSAYDYRKMIVRENGKIIFNERTGMPKTQYVFVPKEKLPSKVRLIVIDEAYQVNEQMARDLLSFNVPILTLGDENQLPPVFGLPYFLKKPDVKLTKVMRQSENSPIITLSQEILKGKELKPLNYGDCSVIKRADLNDFLFKDADIVLTGTNKLRHAINDLYRQHYLKLHHLEFPNEGEKVICRRNNANQTLEAEGNTYYLTNGMLGYVEYVDMESYNGKTFKMDFRPDFIKKKKYKNLLVNHSKMFEPGIEKDEFSIYDNSNKFEFAYAITVHLSQGSQFENVLFLPERCGMDKETYKKYLYTGVTRARQKLTVAI